MKICTKYIKYFSKPNDGPKIFAKNRGVALSIAQTVFVLMTKVIKRNHKKCMISFFVICSSYHNYIILNQIKIDNYEYTRNGRVQYGGVAVLNVIIAISYLIINMLRAQLIYKINIS